KITVILNYIDYTDDPDEARDGPQHLAALDQCDASDALRTRRRTLAVEASSDVLDALFGRDDRATKMARVNAALARHLAYSPGCTFDNGWCNAPERALANQTCGCRVGRRTGSDGIAALLTGAVLLAAARRRRRLYGALMSAFVAKGAIAGTANAE